MKRFFTWLLLGFFIVSNYIPIYANFNYWDVIEMKLVGWEGEWFDGDKDERRSTLQSNRWTINISDLHIYENNIVEWLRSEWFYLTIPEAVVYSKWKIVWNLLTDGTLELSVSGISRNNVEATEWNPGLCNQYLSNKDDNKNYSVNEFVVSTKKEFRDSINLEGFFDKKTWIVKITTDVCVIWKRFYFESTEGVDLISCEEDEIYIDEKCKSISDLCSDDYLVNYDKKTEECYCPDWYKLTDKKTCKEVEEMMFEVSYPEQKPPFFMDGKEYKIKVSVKNGETGKPMKANKLAINYTSAPKQWQITNIEELSIGEYMLTYKTAVIENWNMDGWMDWLYIFYDSKIEAKEIYKTYEIPLWTWTPIKIQKVWFQENNASVLFTSPMAEVKIIVVDSKWKKVWINDAKVSIWWTLSSERTDTNGIAILKSPKTVSSNKKQEILEIVLFPTEEIQEYQKETLEQYKQIIQGENPLASPEVRTFVEDFPVYLAQLTDEEVDDAIIWLKRVGYTLLYMTEGKTLIDDISTNVAWSLKNQLTDTLDLIWASEKVSKYLGQKINTKIDVSKLQDLAPSINKKLDSLWTMLQEKTINTLKLWIQKYAPTFKTERTNELLWVVFGKYGRDDLLKKWVEEIQKVPVDKVEKMIKEYLMKTFDAMLIEKMKDLEGMIKQKNFSIVGFENDISLSKLESLSLRDKYMTAHEVSYDVAMIKNYADLANNIAGETMKITQIYKKHAEIAEKWYKAIRSLFLNTTEIYYRVDAYGEFIWEVEANIDRGIWIAYHSIEESLYTQKGIFSQVYAEGSVLTFEQKSAASTYRWGESLLGIQHLLLTINNIFLKVYPEDENLLSIKKEIEYSQVEEQKILDDLWEQIKVQAKILDKGLWSSNINVDAATVGDWIIVIVSLWLLTGIILFIRWFTKKIRWRRKK